MLARLQEFISAVCPVVSLSQRGEQVTIHYAPEATLDQETAAQLVLQNFDWSAEAHAAWVRGKKREAAIAWINSDEPMAIAMRAALILNMAEIRGIKQGSPRPTASWNALKSQVESMINNGMGDPEYNPDAV